MIHNAFLLQVGTIQSTPTPKSNPSYILNVLPQELLFCRHPGYFNPENGSPSVSSRRAGLSSTGRFFSSAVRLSPATTIMLSSSLQSNIYLELCLLRLDSGTQNATRLNGKMSRAKWILQRRHTSSMEGLITVSCSLLPVTSTARRTGHERGTRSFPARRDRLRPSSPSEITGLAYIFAHVGGRDPA